MTKTLDRLKSRAIGLTTQFAIRNFMDVVHRTDYVRKFSWFGRPILQLPTDVMALQELIWEIQPRAIVECGIGFGGLTTFLSSMMHACHNDEGIVCGVDMQVTELDLDELSATPYSENIELVEGDSVSMSTFRKVKRLCRGKKPLLVILDSDHTHSHVLAELQLYSQLVTVGSYIVVMDTTIEFLDPKYISKGKPWCKGNNPMTAVWEFMEGNKKFKIDKSIPDKILLTSAADGWLKRVSK